MNDLIRREDAIEVVYQLRRKPNDDEWDWWLRSFNAIPSADRPQGDVDAVAIFEREMHNLERGYITIGEFDERIEPLRHLCYGRPQGKWIKDEDGTYRCSNCGGCEEQYIYGTENWYGRGESKFCPSCGARMRKGADDEVR